LVALDRTPVKAPASGTVVEVLVSVGQKVKQGEVLMRLSQGRGGSKPSPKDVEELKRLQAELGAAGDGKPKDLSSLRRKVTQAQKAAFAARRAADNLERLAKRKKASARQVSEAKERLREARQDLGEARRRLAAAK